MRNTGSARAVRAASLLIGFYALGFGLLLALAGCDIGLAEAGAPGALLIKVVLASLVLALPIVRGIFFTRGNRMRDVPGLAITPAHEPQLWQRVRTLAEQVGTRPPHEIRLTADVNAAVHENSRLLGLLPGRRRMFLGVPLLIGLTPAQFDAVVAHELGHYSNRDTRMAGLVHRGRASMLNTLRLQQRSSGAGALLFGLYQGYAQHFLRTTEAISREQELAADQAAAGIAGRDNTADALRRLPALDAGYACYLTRYVRAGRAAGLRPTAEEYLGGFRHLLADPDRVGELDSISRDLPEEQAAPFDSHPPIAVRVAAVEQRPEDGRGRDAGSALSLLRDPAAALGAVARHHWPAETAALGEADWPALMHSAGRHAAVGRAAGLLGAAQALTGRPGSLALVLDLVDAGRLDQLTATLPEPPAARGSTGRLRDEQLRTAFKQALTALAEVAVADAGWGGWPLSWARTGGFAVHGGMTPQQFREILGAAVDPVLGTPPSTAALRAQLGAALAVPPPQPGPYQYQQSSHQHQHQHQ